VENKCRSAGNESFPWTDLVIGDLATSVFFHTFEEIMRQFGDPVGGLLSNMVS